MLVVRAGQFPMDMHGRIPLPMVKWVSDSHTLVKAVNAPFMLSLSQDGLQWSIIYQETNNQAWRTLGGYATLDCTKQEVCVETDNHHSKEKEIDFWMRLKKM